MKKYLIGTCGNYDSQSHIGNGQIIRTATVTRALKEKVGAENLCTLSYHGWRRNPIGTLMGYIRLIMACENVIIFPDSRAYKVLINVGRIFKRLFRTRLYYNVIGGWLPKYIENDPSQIKKIRSLDGLFVQTGLIRDWLNRLGITKVTVFPNFKYIKVFGEDELNCRAEKPLPVYFMSRVAEEKGVVEMIEAMKKVNADRVKYTLDIYGQIDSRFEEEFRRLEADFPEYIRYCGIAKPDETSRTAQKYFLQIFPTKSYDMEGFPGSVLDSFCAGVPVLAARWHSCEDVITDNVDGLLFGFMDYEDMKAKLDEIYENPGIILDMKRNCLKKANLYKPEVVIDIMCGVLGIGV